MCKIQARVTPAIRDWVANKAGMRGAPMQDVICELLERGIGLDKSVEDFVEALKEAYSLGGSLGWEQIGKLLEERYDR